MAPSRIESSSDSASPLLDERNGPQGPEAIAVVGLATGFPADISNPELLWKAMLQERCTVSDFPESRMNINAIYHPDPDRKGQVAVRRAHFMDQDLAAFDAPFFSISTTDAASMDPQQRLLLEYTYIALENAGLTMKDVAGSRTSCFVGSFCTDWQHLSFRDGEECAITAATGATPSLNANRVSWFFDFMGNSANVDTACSSSLVCLDMGIQGLRSGKENMSVVAGANIIVSPDNMHSMTNLNMLSPDGRSYSFDDRGNGYSRGEGFGVLVLKRVSDAVRDGDTIRGIIRNSGCNQDGKTLSITVPNGSAQSQLIREVYAEAHLDMIPTRYFEAHGTGTPVGDPMEANAFGAVFRQIRSDRDPLYVGAAKANIGHLEGASGIASFIRALLVLEKAVIPPICGFQKLNGKIDADYLKLKFPTAASPWPVKGLRRASVNSFGNGGTNSHVVLDDVYHFLESRGMKGNHLTRPDPPKLADASLAHESEIETSIAPPARNVPHLLVFSSMDQAGTGRITKAYETYFSKLNLTPDQEATYIHNLSYTLAHRRSQFPWRSYALVQSAQDLQKLSTLATPSKSATKSPGIGFIFTGQGAQWAGMARELLAFPVFKTAIVRLDDALSSIGCPWKLTDAILHFDQNQISQPDVSQPLCTAVQIALIDLLRWFDVSATSAIGHSSGEIAAAFSIGALSEKSAMRVGYFRGLLASRLPNSSGPKGAMMAAGLSEEKARGYLKQAAELSVEPADLVVACINSPYSVTISGSESQIIVLGEILSKEQVFNRRLPVNVAYHSPHTKAIADEYCARLQDLEPGIAPVQPVTMISTVTGKQATPSQLRSADYWVDNLVSPVKFSPALAVLVSRRANKMRKKLDLSHRTLLPLNILVEIGPHSTLKGPIRDTLADFPHANTIDYTSCLIRKKSAAESFLEAVGHLHAIGYPINLDKTVSGGKTASGVVLTDLPSYPFDHSKQYWEESRISAQYRNQTQSRLDLLGKPVTDWNPLEPRWRNKIKGSEMSWVEDHLINGSLIYPGAGMLSMAIEAAYQVAERKEDIQGIELKEVSFLKSLNVPQDTKGVETQLSIHKGTSGSKLGSTWDQFTLYGYMENAWVECCRGSVRPRYKPQANDINQKDEAVTKLSTRLETYAELYSSCQTPINPERMYGTFNANGLGLGPAFHRLQKGSYDDQMRVVGEIELYKWPEKEYPQEHIVHPTSLDAIFHVAIAGYSKGGERDHDTMIPTFLGHLFVDTESLSSHDRAHVLEGAWLNYEDRRSTDYGAFVLDANKTKVIAHFEHLELTRVAQARSKSEDDVAVQTAFNIDYVLDVDNLSHKALLAHSQIDSRPDLVRYLQLLGDKKSGLSVLEIGEQGKGLAAGVVEQLASSVHFGGGGLALSRDYVYASSSEEAIEEAQKRLKSLASVQYMNIDVAGGLNAQGLLSKFDVIFVPSQLDSLESVARGLPEVMANGAKIVLYNAETSNTCSLKAFTNSGLTLYSGGKSFQVFTGTVVEESAPPLPISVVYDESSKIQKAFVQTITKAFGSSERTVTATSLANAAATVQEGIIYVVALELDQALLYTVSSKDFGNLKTLLLVASDVLWVNYEGGSLGGKPEFTLITGLARALQRERDELRMTIASLEANDGVSEEQLAFLEKVLKSHANPPEFKETEYLELNGAVHVPRARPSAVLTDELHSRALPKVTETGLVKDAVPLQLNLGVPGQFDTLHFQEDLSAAEPLADDEIEVSVAAVGLTYKDVLVGLNQISKASFGQEAAGTVTKAGSKSGFAVGDRVLLNTSSAFRTLVRAKKDEVFPLPSNLSLAIAASIPTQFGAAWTIIHDIAHLQSGETILIHAAAGGTGQAAIQIAQNAGAIVYTTVGSHEKKQILMDQYGIRADHIFYSRDTSFAESVQRVTGGKGVDVIINTLGGDITLASWECIAAYGRFIQVGSDGLASNQALGTASFGKNASFIGFDSSVFKEVKPENMRKNVQGLVNRFASGTLHTAYPFRVLDISEVETGFKELNSGNTAGKTVFTISETSEVKMTLARRKAFDFSPNETYLIAGGLGGLGRATARWMVSRGAKNLILLSRSGPRTEAAFEVLDELRSQGVRVETPACDITSLPQMKDVLGKLMAGMPPIKGCLQASIVARDGIFENMTHDDWRVAVDCKSIGSWNLHTVLPSGMNFFIILASASGLAGIKGQTNYDAGNVYEDNIARYRVSKGEKAVSFDLGAMQDDGILSENPELLNRVLGYGTLEAITRTKFFALLDYYCDPSRNVLKPKDCQVSIGIGLGGGSGLESVNYAKQPMMYPLQVLGEKIAAADSSSSGDKSDFRRKFASSSSLDEAGEIVVAEVVNKLGKSLSTMANPESLDLRTPLQVYGVDSLLAIELRNWIAKELQAEVAVFETQGAATLETLSFLVARRCTVRHSAWSAVSD